MMNKIKSKKGMLFSILTVIIFMILLMFVTLYSIEQKDKRSKFENVLDPLLLDSFVDDVSQEVSKQSDLSLVLVNGTYKLSNFEDLNKTILMDFLNAYKDEKNDKFNISFNDGYLINNYFLSKNELDFYDGINLSIIVNDSSFSLENNSLTLGDEVLIVRFYDSNNTLIDIVDMRINSDIDGYLNLSNGFSIHLRNKSLLLLGSHEYKLEMYFPDKPEIKTNNILNVTYGDFYFNDNLRFTKEVVVKN